MVNVLRYENVAYQDKIARLLTLVRTSYFVHVKN